MEQGTETRAQPAGVVSALSSPLSSLLPPLTWLPRLLLLALLLLSLLAYLPVWHSGFVWDDFLLLKSNPLVTGELNLRTVWFQTDFPLSTVGFWLEWLAFGKQPLGYHVVNLVLHALSVVLVWRLLAQLRVRGAWLAAALFAVHPVGVPSVAWVSELKNTLSLPCFLLSLLCYLRGETVARQKSPASSLPAGGENREIRGRESDQGIHSSRSDAPTLQRCFRPPSAIFYPLSFLCFLLALLSKTSTVMLPVVLLLCAWWQRGRLRRADWLRTGPFFVLALGFGLLTVWFQSHQAFTTATVQTENLWARLAGAGRAVWFYLGKALLPLQLSAIYPRWTIQANSLLSWLPALALGGTFLLLWTAARRAGAGIQERDLPDRKAFLWCGPHWARHVLFGLGCFGVTLFPALGFFDMYYLALSRVADQFQYLSLVAIVALVAAALVPGGRAEDGAASRERLPAPRSTLYALRLLPSGSLLLALTLLTFQRAQTWSANESLWRDTLARNPEAWTAHNNLGCIRAEQREYAEAVTHFTASVQLNPANADAEANLGQALALQGRFTDAEPHFRTALRLKPESANAHLQFASALVGQGRLSEAALHLRQALRLQPTTALRQQYAALLYQTGHPGEAIHQLRLALSSQPDAPELLNNLAWLLATGADSALRNGPEAVRLAEGACQLTQSRQPVFLATLAAAYAEANRFPEAVTTAELARNTARAAHQENIARQTEALLGRFRAGAAYHEESRRP